MDDLTPISGLSGSPNLFAPRGVRFVGEDGNVYDGGEVLDKISAMAAAAILSVVQISANIVSITLNGRTGYQCILRTDIADIPATAQIGETAVAEEDWSIWVKGVAGTWAEVII